MGSMLHCAAVQRSTGLGFNPETSPGSEPRGVVTAFPSNRNHMAFLSLRNCLPVSSLPIQRIYLTREHGNAKAAVAFDRPGDVSQELGSVTHTHPVPSGGM